MAADLQHAWIVRPAEFDELQHALLKALSGATRSREVECVAQIRRLWAVVAHSKRSDVAVSPALVDALLATATEPEQGCVVCGAPTHVRGTRCAANQLASCDSFVVLCVHCMCRAMTMCVGSMPFTSKLHSHHCICACGGRGSLQASPFPCVGELPSAACYCMVLM
jgi:hypothetical protein